MNDINLVDTADTGVTTTITSDTIAGIKFDIMNFHCMFVMMIVTKQTVLNYKIDRQTSCVLIFGCAVCVKLRTEYVEKITKTMILKILPFRKIAA